MVFSHVYWKGPATSEGSLSLFEGPDQLHVTLTTPLGSEERGVISFILQGKSIEAATFSAKVHHITGLQLQLQLVPTEIERFQSLIGQLRKGEHLAFCEEEEVEASDRFTGFSSFSFVPHALSGCNWNELDIHTSFLNRSFQAPFLITGMTGGVERGHQINRRLAKAASVAGIPMGIGSQRVALEDPACAKVFQLKTEYPDLFLIGNLGVAQLLSPHGVAWCQQAVDMVQADALALHLNVVQECMQPEGDRNFSGIVDKIHEVCAQLSVPVLVKEVGCGLDLKSAVLLQAAGVAALDVGGRGGTSWPYIEGLRSHDALRQTLAGEFRNWGIPTAYGVHALREACPELPLVATGGMRSGLMAAKAIALGANLVGIGLPLMQAALESEDRVTEVLDSFVEGLRVTMLATGSRSLKDLRHHIGWGHPYETRVREAFLSSRGPVS